jgi:hypothetical protein
MAPSPLLEFFKRGEVARDVRLLAARGLFAPRAHEQLAILVLLLDDAEAEIRETAEKTLARIPPPALSRFLARPDAPAPLREFFAARGIHPADPADASATSGDGAEPLEVKDEASDAPLVDDGEEVEDPENETNESVTQRLAKMSFTQRLKAAVKGSREMRAILIRDPNKMISAAVLSSPKLSEIEVESIARMANVSEEVLRTIATNRSWTKNYSVVVGLTKNPKTPVAMSMNLMHRLSDRDLNQLAVDRNVPEPLRAAARKRVLDSTSKR